MTGIVITGYGSLSCAGSTPATLASALMAGFVCPGDDVRNRFEEELPCPRAHILADFNARRSLGRKGTVFFDRLTGLAVVACGDALADSGLGNSTTDRARVGVVIGTGEGSLKSTSDLARETLTDPRPYQGNPAQFPNSVMNCAAGQAAIWHGLRGVNSTLACGTLSFLAALRYATVILRGGYADAMLVGAVEEFTPHSAWLTRLVESPDQPGRWPGEGAAVVVLERTEHARRANRQPRAELLSVVTGFSPNGTGDEALVRCARLALTRANLEPDELSFFAHDHELDGFTPATRIKVKDVVGDCRAAAGGLQLVALIALHESGRDGGCSMIVGRSRGGGVGAAVIRGRTRVHIGGQAQ